MHNKNGIVLLKNLETTLRETKVSAMQNNSGFALSVDVLSNNEVSTMDNRDGIFVSKALETTLSKTKISAIHKNSENFFLKALTTTSFCVKMKLVQ